MHLLLAAGCAAAYMGNYRASLAIGRLFGSEQTQLLASLRRHCVRHRTAAIVAPHVTFRSQLGTEQATDLHAVAALARKRAPTVISNDPERNAMTSEELYCTHPTPRVSRMRQTRDTLSESDAHEQLLCMFASDLLPTVPPRAVEIARRLFSADAAGLHLCRNDARTAVQQRNVICGALSKIEAEYSGMSRHLCRMCLDAGAPVVLSQQEIELTALRDVRPRVAQVLMVPLYDSVKRPLGALWVAQVTSTATYSRADAHVLGRFANILVLGLQLLTDAHKRAQLAAAAEKEREKERKTHAELLYVLREERGKRENAEVAAANARRALAFRDAAVGEAHHRVKNTLQIVSSLLATQARLSNEPDTQIALKEARTRLQLLTQAHERLSRTILDGEELSAAHLLRVVADTLPSAFADTSSRVRLELTAEQISMSAQDATALGLIANELVMNAYKHAFANGATGIITMQLTSDETSSAILRISDDGVGGSREPGAGSFGLRLVHELAEQLGGTMELSAGTDNGLGRRVTLTIPRSAVLCTSVEAVGVAAVL